MSRRNKEIKVIQVIDIKGDHSWDLIEKLFNNIRFVNDCWIRGNDSTVYTSIKYNGKKVHAHRVSYELFTGKKILNFGCHHCDVKACINPIHVFDGTARQNHWDARRKGRVFDVVSKRAAEQANRNLKFAYKGVPELKFQLPRPYDFMNRLKRIIS